MKKAIVIFFSVLLITVSAAAQSLPNLIIGSDPVSFGLAGSSVARNADAFAVENKPAAMSLAAGKMSFAASYGLWAPSLINDRIIGAGGFYRVTDKLAFGILFKDIMGRQYDISSDAGVVTGTFSPSGIVAGIGLSYRLADFVSVGINGRYASSSISESMKGSTFVAYVTASSYKGDFNASLGICNLGPSINYGAGGYKLPSLARAGAAYSIAGLTASLEADCFFSGAFNAALGLEYNLSGIAFLRAGYHYGNNSNTLPSFASAGLGIKLSGFELNAAYLFGSESLGSTMMFGLGYSF